MNKKLIGFLLACVVLILTGCAVKLPAVSTYLITSSHTHVIPKSSQSAYTLLISPMIANPGYDKKKMIYVTDPAHLNFYTRHEWVAPPARMLTPLIAERIQDTGYFRAVVISPYMGKTNYRLDTRLVVLQQEFLSSTSQVRCIIQATLMNVRTKTIVASQRFQVVVPAGGQNPQSGVTAANYAVNQITAQIAQFTVGAIK